MRLLLGLCLAASTTLAFDFDKYQTCKSCVKVGKGWCPIARRCGNFANNRCDIGERYFGNRELYLVATIKRLKKKAKGGDEDAKEEAKKLKDELKQLRQELAEEEEGGGDEVVAADEDEEPTKTKPPPTEGKKKRRRRKKKKVEKVEKKEEEEEVVAGDEDEDEDDSAMAEVAAEAKRRKAAAKGKPKSAPVVDLRDGEVLKLTPRNFTAAVLESSEPWIVEFYSPFCSMCDMFNPEYKNAAAKLAGQARVGAVDADKHKDLASKFNVGGYPSLRLFMADKAKPISKNVPWRMGAKDPLTEDAVVDMVLTEAANMPKKEKKVEKVEKATKAEGSCTAGGSSLDAFPGVIPLTPKNFSAVLASDMLWMVAFSAPEIGGIPSPSHASFFDEWTQAAQILRGVVRLGVVDADAYPDLLKDYDVDTIPAVRVWLSEDKSQMPKDYTARRDASTIVDWITQKLERLFKDRDKKIQRQRRFGK